MTLDLSANELIGVIVALTVIVGLVLSILLLGDGN